MTHAQLFSILPFPQGLDAQTILNYLVIEGRSHILGYAHNTIFFGDSNTAFSINPAAQTLTSLIRPDGTFPTETDLQNELGLSSQ